MPRNEVLVGDARAELRRLPPASIDMALTSPPYFRLRDYQVDGQLGLEADVDAWVSSLRAVAREVQRCLVPTGSFWLNLADTYSTHPSQGAGRKSLVLGPERLALALLADGWLLRNKIIWQKSNPVPTSVQDRLNCTWDAVYVFVRQPRYFFDLDAVRVPYSSPRRKPAPGPRKSAARESWQGPNSARGRWQSMTASDDAAGHPLGKNPGDVWRIAGSSYRGGHHATFPVALPERAILAGCPQARCTACRLPWKRQLIRSLGGTAVRGALGPSCGCGAGNEPGLVLDPFFGAGTTAVAAERLQRDWLGIELNPAFAKLARERIQDARAGPTRRAA